MLPAVKHYDTEGRVVFLGTFSKIFSPGLRLGWINASEEIIDKFNLIKQGADFAVQHHFSDGNCEIYGDV